MRCRRLWRAGWVLACGLAPAWVSRPSVRSSSCLTRRAENEGLTWLGSSLGSAKLVTALKLVTMTTSPQPVWKLFGEDCIIDASRPSADWTRMEVGQTIFQISKDPPMQVVPDFLSPKEVDELLALVRDRWQPSMIDPYGTGEVQRSVLDRSSYQCDLRFQETPLVAQVEGRLAGLAQLPVECLEPLALVRYAPGQFFDLHHDGPDRPKTIFVYLNDVEEGETYFPLLGLKFTPRRGTAVMWCNSADGQVDDRILQDLALPAWNGMKYGMNCFFNCQVSNVNKRLPSTHIDAQPPACSPASGLHGRALAKEFQLACFEHEKAVQLPRQSSANLSGSKVSGTVTPMDTARSSRPGSMVPSVLVATQAQAQQAAQAACAAAQAKELEQARSELEESRANAIRLEDELKAAKSEIERLAEALWEEKQRREAAEAKAAAQAAASAAASAREVQPREVPKAHVPPETRERASVARKPESRPTTSESPGEAPVSARQTEALANSSLRGSSLRRGSSPGARKRAKDEVEEKLGEYLINSPHCKLEFCRSRGSSGHTVRNTDSVSLLGQMSIVNGKLMVKLEPTSHDPRSWKRCISRGAAAEAANVSMVALTFGDEIGYGPVFRWLNTVSSALSVAGCLVVIGAFLAFPALRRYFARLVLYLAISDLWLCTSFLMGEFESPHYTKCTIQSMLGIFFGLSSVLWTVAIADSIRRIVMAQDLTVESRHEKRLHILAWGLPLLSVFAVLLLGAQGQSGMVCWIENSALGTVLRLATFYLPLWLAIAYSLWVYWCVSQRLSQLLEQASSSNADEYEGTAFEYHQDLERQRRSLRMMMLLPLILVFCWSPSSIRRLLDVIFPNMQRSVLDYVCVFAGPLQGFLNAVVYGSTPAVRDALTGRFDHGAAKLKSLKTQLRVLRKKRQAEGARGDMERRLPKGIWAVGKPPCFFLFCPRF
ncbi:unnamed protein product [Effrenium voratum]|nr:unnamed protein product [Effrenium voratum]